MCSPPEGLLACTGLWPSFIEAPWEGETSGFLWAPAPPPDPPVEHMDTWRAAWIRLIRIALLTAVDAVARQQGLSAGLMYWFLWRSKGGPFTQIHRQWQTLLLGVFENGHWVYSIKCRPKERNFWLPIENKLLTIFVLWLCFAAKETQFLCIMPLWVTFAQIMHDTHLEFFPLFQWWCHCLFYEDNHWFPEVDTQNRMDEGMDLKKFPQQQEKR